MILFSSAQLPILLPKSPMFVPGSTSPRAEVPVPPSPLTSVVKMLFAPANVSVNGTVNVTGGAEQMRTVVSSWTKVVVVPVIVSARVGDELLPTRTARRFGLRQCVRDRV